ncbi:MAG TPA: P-loop NTPase, partial [Candidatus Limnocylindrales bacterium]|nr:P-loop NTPase [Candidatus Limnocylindrales bacterium]
MDKCAVLLVGMKPDVEGQLASALGQQQAVRSAADVASARLTVQRVRPAIAVVALGAGSPDQLELVRELATSGTAVICVGAKKDSDLILAAMRAGAREYLVAGEHDLLDKTVQGFLETSGALRLGEVTAIVPAKGGMGGTTIAINLAGALHRQGRRVCIVDLGVELGDVLSFLDVKGTYSI